MSRRYTLEEIFRTVGLEIPELVKPDNVRIVRSEIMLSDEDFEALLKGGWKMKDKRGPCAPDEILLHEFYATRNAEVHEIPGKPGLFHGKKPPIDPSPPGS